MGFQEEIAERWPKTVFVVEADDFAQFYLWRNHSHEHLEMNGRADGRFDGPRHKWEQMNPGYLVTIGKIKKMPVCVSVTWNKIDGYLVAFYEAVSRVVDHDMVRDWINKMTQPGVGHCNAMNFHLCLQEIEAQKTRMAKQAGA